jgi:hypothetical protein
VLTVPGGRPHECDLEPLLATAKDLRARHQVPIVLVLGWLLDGSDRQSMYVGAFFEQTFTMTAASRDAFLHDTQLLGRLRDAPLTDESYDVFILWQGNLLDTHAAAIVAVRGLAHVPPREPR